MKIELVIIPCGILKEVLSQRIHCAFHKSCHIEKYRRDAIFLGLLP